MENSEVVEKQAVVGKLIDLSESEPASETIENVVTFLNESALPDILSIADDNVSEDSDHSVVIIDDSSVDSAYLLEVRLFFRTPKSGYKKFFLFRTMKRMTPLNLM